MAPMKLNEKVLLYYLYILSEIYMMMKNCGTWKLYLLDGKNI